MNRREKVLTSIYKLFFQSMRTQKRQTQSQKELNFLLNELKTKESMKTLTHTHNKRQTNRQTQVKLIE